MSDNFDPDQDRFQTTLNGDESTVESEKCWWLQSIFLFSQNRCGPTVPVYFSRVWYHTLFLWIKKTCLKCLSWFKQTILSPIAADQRTLEINREKKYTIKFTHPATKGKLSKQCKYWSDKFKYWHDWTQVVLPSVVSINFQSGFYLNHAVAISVLYRIIFCELLSLPPKVALSVSQVQVHMN